PQHHAPGVRGQRDDGTGAGGNVLPAGPPTESVHLTTYPRKPRTADRFRTTLGGRVTGTVIDGYRVWRHTATNAAFQSCACLSCSYMRSVSTTMVDPSFRSAKRSMLRVARPERNVPSGAYFDLCFGHWNRPSAWSHRSAVFWCGHARENAYTFPWYRARIRSLSRSIVAPSAAGI